MLYSKQQLKWSYFFLRNVATAVLLFLRCNLKRLEAFSPSFDFPLDRILVSGEIFHASSPIYSPYDIIYYFSD